MRRMRIPSEWFALMGQPKSVVVMAHPEEKCLVLLSEDAYKAHVGQMRRQAKTNADAQKELAYLLGEAEHLCVNDHNSIRICDKLLRFARIKEQVSLSEWRSSKTARGFESHPIRQFAHVHRPWTCGLGENDVIRANDSTLPVL